MNLKKVDQTQGDANHFGERLALRLVQLDLKPIDLARAMNYAQSAVYRWLDGSLPHRRERKKLADVLTCSGDWLFTGQGMEPGQPIISGLEITSDLDSFISRYGVALAPGADLTSRVKLAALLLEIAKPVR